ncbi:hypothetical protein REH65_31440 [Saccharopolyspora sp. ID03-671]|uniref:hypothetical protein n=1 Tax=Saccharopolyspora sp. ID03-671 TaxID=3073066 RepID=UPI003244E9C9
MEQYLPAPCLGDDNLGTFHLAMYPYEAQFRELTRLIRQAPDTQRIEPIPGVMLLEAREPSGARNYAVKADALEHQVDAYAVRVHHRNIELYLPRGARDGYPLRLMREAMLRTHEDHGGTVFHAGGADLAGHGVLICGPRSAGKTTLLTQLIRATRAAVLSNDRVIVQPSGRMVAVPLPVPVARGTLESVPELTQAASTSSRPQPAVAQLPRRFGTAKKAAFTAREYASALNTSITAESWLNTILVPRLSDSTEPLRLRTLSEAETEDTLRANCFTPHDEFWQRPWLVPRTTPDADLQGRSLQLIRGLVTRVACVEIRFGIRNSPEELTRALANLSWSPACPQ